MAERTFPACQSQLESVQRFIRDQVTGYQCSDKVRFQLEVAVEEIFVNIANYAYQPGEGEAVVRCSVEENPLQVTIQFLDHGKPFNPLLRENMDITLSAEKRRIGGLGILMVKKSMDAVQYEYRDGKNILTIKKNL
jgi:anti-sigma regulatory factor (Ser/Thr protein kinase)